MSPIIFMKRNRLRRPSKAIMCLISTFFKASWDMQDLLQENKWLTIYSHISWNLTIILLMPTGSRKA